MRLMTVRLLACVLLVWMPAAGVKPVVVEAGWDDLRTAIGNTDFLPTVRVWTGVDGKSKIKARFGRITDSGLVLTKNGKALSIDRSEVHSIRLVPRKASTRKHRNAAAIAAAPIGFGASYGFMFLTCATARKCLDGPWSPAQIVFQLGAVAVAAPYLVYRLARKADRGSVVFELKN